MRDTDDEIREIKREIIESRGLIIKTNNLTNSLSADIKSIAKRQVGYERRFNWNSGVAYVLFAGLAFTGLKFWSDVRINEIESEKEGLTREVAELRRNLAEETRRAEKREQAEQKAAAFYGLIRQKKRTKVVEEYNEIQQEQLSKAEANFFKDTVDRFRLDLSVKAYQAGLGLIRTARYSEAARKLQEAIDLQEGASHIPAVKLYLGVALRKLGRSNEALLLAKEVLDQEVDKDLQVEGAWLLSRCAEDVGDIDQARKILRLLLRRWARSARVPDARKRLGELNRRIWAKPKQNSGQ
jgi:tetratricopeptide (TPR) repeat protein